MLSFDEIKECLVAMGFDVASEEVREIIANCGNHGDQRIHYSDFLTATVASKVRFTEEQLWAAFKRFDNDDTGVISEENLTYVLHAAGKTVKPGEVHQMIAEVDQLHNGIITFEEFKLLMQPPDPVRPIT
jgi:calmodulin